MKKVRIHPPNFQNPKAALKEFKKLNWNGLRIAISILLVLSFCTHCACTWFPVWLKQYDIHSQGIWRVCSQTRDGIKCLRYIALPDYYITIQAMMVTGGAIHVLSFIYFVYMLKLKTRSALPLAGTLTTTGILSIIALSIFTEKNLKTVLSSSMKFGWSYFVGWIASGICIIAAVLSFQDARRKLDNSESSIKLNNKTLTTVKVNKKLANKNTINSNH
ncbi:claudin domain-containing protein 2-like isoform X1 [Hydra vulgaris]|uniref:Claudin domain-containing protein 2-like isoform X1 n=1 Tax=Hydra vulgaris TaxID=6087 RepID=A0ABM4DIW2_HYDVU